MKHRITQLTLITALFIFATAFISSGLVFASTDGKDSSKLSEFKETKGFFKTWTGHRNHTGISDKRTCTLTFEDPKTGDNKVKWKYTLGNGFHTPGRREGKVEDGDGRSGLAVMEFNEDKKRYQVRLQFKSKDDMETIFYFDKKGLCGEAVSGANHSYEWDLK